MSANRIILVRHAKTEFNITGRFQGHEDVDLGEEGLQQARTTAEALMRYEPSAIVSSDLKRALRTAEALAELSGLLIHIDPNLREIDVGRWSGLPRAEIMERWPEEFAAYDRGDNVVIGGGESRSQATDRVVAAIRRTVRDNEGTVVVVSHGASIRGAIVRLLGLPDDRIASFAGMDNGNWHVLSARSEDQYRLVEYNSSVRVAERLAESTQTI